MSLIYAKEIDTDEFGNKQSENTFECYINPAEIKAIVIDGDIGHIAFIYGGEITVERKSVDALIVAARKD